MAGRNRKAMVDFVPMVGFPSLAIPSKKMNAAGLYSTHSPFTFCFQLSVDFGDAHSSSSQAVYVRNHYAPSMEIITHGAPTVEV